MDEFRKYSKIASAIAFFIIPIVYYLTKDNSYKKYMDDNIKPMKINGVLINKSINLKNHGNVIFEIKERNLSKTINLSGCDSSLFINLQVNDSIVKNEGQYRFLVYRNNKKYWYSFW